MKRIGLFPFAVLVLVLAAGCGEVDLTEPGAVTTADPALNTTAGEDVTPPILTAFSFTPTTINTTSGPANQERPVGPQLGTPQFALAPLIDQEQPVINTTAGVTLAIGGSSQQKLAQVVTAGLPGVLTEVRFPVSCASGSDLLVEIQGVTNDKPNGIVLTSSTFPGLPPFTQPPTFASLVLSSPVSFRAGDRFAIVLSSTGSCGIFLGPVGDPYPGGDAFFDARPNAPGEWVRLFFSPGIQAGVDLPFQTLVQRFVVEVTIDIKPGSDPNSINPKSKGTIPVAILSTTDFDATTEVDKASLTFGKTGDEASLAKCTKSNEDVNGDGLDDVVCHFNTQDTGFQQGDTEGILRGETVGGVPMEGRDAVRIVIVAGPIAGDG